MLVIVVREQYLNIFGHVDMYAFHIRMFLRIINPRRMREGYSSRFVCLCVCLCVCLLPH